MSDGTLIQWGHFTASDWMAAVNIPIPYINSDYVVTATYISVTGEGRTLSVGAKGNALFCVNNAGYNNWACDWLAIGRWISN